MCGYMQGNALAVVSAEDLIQVLATKIKGLLCQTAKAFVERETGAISGIERAVEATTAPSLGQQMLQRGSRLAVANGTSHEESSVSVNPEGNEVAERLVERGVLLPNGQGVQIQQAAQQLILRDSELGKRKIDNDLHRVELRLQNLKCDQLQVECEQKRMECEQKRTQ